MMAADVLIAVKEAMLPEPVAARPMLVLLFTQVYVVPLMVPVKVTVVVAAPLHTVCEEGETTTGVGLTVAVIVVTAVAVPSDTSIVNMSVPP